jgi:hypothetical protein
VNTQLWLPGVSADTLHKASKSIKYAAVQLDAKAMGQRNLAKTPNE